MAADTVLDNLRLRRFAHGRGRLRECLVVVAAREESVERGVCGSAGGVRQGGVHENLNLRDDRGWSQI